MMAAEGPILAAILARLAEPKQNLAAYGVAIAIAMLVEAPIIMVMSAANTLVVDRRSYRTLRDFSFALDALVTLFMGLVAIPPVFAELASLLALPEAVASRTWTATVLLLPWPGAIGYRRLYQGILIRSGTTRLVAYGTVIRLVTMALTGVVLALATRLEGASIGAASLSAGVVAEAIGSRWMAREAVASLRDSERPALGWGEVARFYYPLAMTSLLNMGIQPIVTFFAARGRMPIESLAVLPVVNSLVFLFRTFGLAGQETFIALDSEGREPLRRFAYVLAAVASGGLALIGWTPLAHAWFEHVSGLTPFLAGISVWPTRVLALMPALTVWMCWQRATLVTTRVTGPVTAATAIEVGSVALVMMAGNALGAMGILSAAFALTVGRLASNTYLMRPGRAALAQSAQQRNPVE
ncbi:MAG TPA: hypothetical protein PLI95_02105 [Polyangiaceae bacterium]|nr:hypothetical protein [Polyangiaceae bacterium]